MKTTPQTARAITAVGRRLAQATSAFALVAMTAAAPTLFAAKGGKPGGGGGDPPPPQAEYTVETIAKPSWGESYSAHILNNWGDVLGTVYEPLGRSYSLLKPGFFWSRESRTVSELPPLRDLGHDGTRPCGLSDDGWLMAGFSSIWTGSIPPAYEVKPVVWVPDGAGGMTVINIAPMLEAYATTSPTCTAWGLQDFDFFINSLPGFGDNILTSDGEFLLLQAHQTAWPAASPEVGVVVRLDRSVPSAPIPAGMWVIGQLPDLPANQLGYRGYGYAIQKGLRDEGTSSEREIVKVSGSFTFVDADGLSSRGTAMLWELDPDAANAVTTVTVLGPDALLPVTNSYGAAYDVNALGECVGRAEPVGANSTFFLYWSSTGVPTRIPSVSGSTAHFNPYAINSAGSVVGNTRTSNGFIVPAIWSAETPSALARNLNTLTSGSWSLDDAFDLNERGEIVAADWGKGSTDQRFYLLTPTTP